MEHRERPVVAIYNRAGNLVDFAESALTTKVTPRWLDPAGEAEITMSSNDHLLPVLREPGTRLMVQLRGEHVVGGPIDRWSVSGPGGDETWTFHVTDDASILNRILCLPDPVKPLNEQPATPVTYRGKLESVVKRIVGLNAPVLGVDTEIVADQGRGPESNVAIPARWQPASEVVIPAMRAAGMGLTVVWQPDTKKLRIDVYEQRTYPIQLSPETKTIAEYDLTVTAPTATRVYIGPQEGTIYQLVTNETVEAEWGPHLRGAVFRSVETDDDPDEARTVATEALNEGSAKSGMALSLSESAYVRYGGVNGLRVGDRATLRIGDVEVTDVVREATIEFTTAGLTIRPAVGAWDARPTFVLVAAVRRMAATLRRYTTR